MDPIRVLIVDDHFVVRKGLQMLLDTEPSIQIVGEAENGREAVRQAQNLNPAVVLMDLVMPERGGIEAIAAIKGRMSHVRIIVLTTFQDDVRVRAAMKAGADGYLLKDAGGEALVQAIQVVQRGGMPLHPDIAQHLIRGTAAQQHPAAGAHLTPREKEVLQLVASGLSNKAVAESLSAGTVKVHVSNILGKLNVSSRTEAAVWAVQMGLASPREGLTRCGLTRR